MVLTLHLHHLSTEATERRRTRAHLSSLAAGRDARGGAQVRSPAEYLKGHIPGAVSLPLFDDDERAAVGTTFTKVAQGESVIK